VAGIEVGNEMNWSAFNGDLPLAAKGQVISDLSQLAPETGSRFEAGMAAYAKAMQIVKTAVSSQGAHIPVVAGALADIDARFVASSGATLVDPDLARSLLNAQGAFHDADAIGVHLYEPLQLNVDAASRSGMIAQKLDACDTPALGGQPCWITEYGIAQWHSKCDIADDDRRHAIGALTAYLAAPENAGGWRPPSFTIGPTARPTALCAAGN
jgi:hypothetical protein